jgi:hypothetical protein
MLVDSGYETGASDSATTGMTDAAGVGVMDAAGGGADTWTAPPVEAGAEGGKDASSSSSSGGMRDAQAETGGPPPPPVDSGLPPTSAKRGLAYGNDSDADLKALSPGISWWYNWSPTPDGTLSNGYYNTVGVEFVPMVWNGNFNTTTLANQIPQGAKYLLTFNEPEDANQGNLTAAKAASLWPQLQSLAQSRGLKLVSPAVNYCAGNCNQTNPYTWLQDFFNACTNCQVDYVAVHSYVCTEGSLYGYVHQFEVQFKKPIWLTEFSCGDGSLPSTAANESNYMSQAIAYLESDPMIFRYSWFTGRSNNPTTISLLGASGVLTSLGQEYVSLPPPK